MAKISQLGATGRKATFLDVLPNDEQTIIYIYIHHQQDSMGNYGHNHLHMVDVS